MQLSGHVSTGAATFSFIQAIERNGTDISYGRLLDVSAHVLLCSRAAVYPVCMRYLDQTPMAGVRGDDCDSAPSCCTQEMDRTLRDMGQGGGAGSGHAQVGCRVSQGKFPCLPIEAF